MTEKGLWLPFNATSKPEDNSICVISYGDGIDWNLYSYTNKDGFTDIYDEAPRGKVVGFCVVVDIEEREDEFDRLRDQAD